MRSYPLETADLVTFTEEVLNRKLFCAVILRLVVDGLIGEGAFLYLADGHIYHTFIPLCLNVFLTFNCYTAFF